MLQYTEDTTSRRTTIPSLTGTVTFRKAVIETEHPADFLMGIECGQACFVDKGTLITRQMLTNLCLELTERDEDIPEAYYMGYLVGFIDALLPNQQTFCCRVCGFHTHADLNAATNIERRVSDDDLHRCKDRKAVKALLMQRHDAWKKAAGWS